VRIGAVLLRDLLRLARNPITLVSTVLLPLLYLFVLGNALQGPLKGLRLGLLALDNGAAARALYGGLQAVENGPRTFAVVSFHDPAAGMDALRGGRIQGLVVVPPDFSWRAARGENVAAGLFLDNVDAISATAIEQGVTGAVAALREPVVRFERHLGPPRVQAEHIYPRVDYDTSLVPGVVVLSIFMASMITGAFNLVMDRFLGVHEAYLSTPLTRVDINVGVLISGTIVTIASSAVVLTVGLLATGASVHGGPLGWLLLAGTVVLTGLGMLSMMMLLLGRAGHPRVVGMVTGFLNILLFFPSGALYPVQSFPTWLRAFAVIDPETHAVAAVKALLFRGGDTAAASGHLAFLAAFTASMLVASTAALKRTL
jgi:ABC-2 type transport system permease protein